MRDGVLAHRAPCGSGRPPARPTYHPRRGSRGSARASRCRARAGPLRRRAVGRLIYSAIASLDGFVADERGDFGWAAPDEEVHAFVNELERPVGTYLYGRRMYEVMAFWETAAALPDLRSVTRDFAAIWQAAEKVVYSTTLAAVSSARTRIERTFDPDAVRRLKETSGRDLSVGGPTLAARALAAGLVDECHLLAVPVVVGGGTRWLPAGVRLELELLDERRFASGVVHLHHRIRT